MTHFPDLWNYFQSNFAITNKYLSLDKQYIPVEIK